MVKMESMDTPNNPPTGLTLDSLFEILGSKLQLSHPMEPNFREKASHTTGKHPFRTLQRRDFPTHGRKSPRTASPTLAHPSKFSKLQPVRLLFAPAQSCQHANLLPRLSPYVKMQPLNLLHPCAHEKILLGHLRLPDERIRFRHDS